MEVEPGNLRLPPSRINGADPDKLDRQLALFGDSTAGMPPIELTACAGGEFVINNGVTRATRIHRYAPPGTRVPAVVTDTRPTAKVTVLPRVKDR